jgi:hypothetical protein
MVLGLLKEGMRLDEIVKLQWYDPRLASLKPVDSVDTKRVDSVDKRVDKPVSTPVDKGQPVDSKVERRKARQRAWIAKRRAKAKERDV